MNTPERILVVDDEKSIRTVIADTLASRGYHVETAASAEAARQLLEKETIDLALIDLKMPGALDGLGLLSIIHSRWQQISVIMMSGYATLDSAILALREGASDYITKPASMTQIVESVERGLSKRRAEFRHQQIIHQIEMSLRELKHEPAGTPNSSAAETERFVKTPTLTIDRRKRLVVRGNAPVELTATEFDLLDCLVRHSDRVVTASELVKTTQGYALTEQEARPLVRVHIRRLRQKLEEEPDAPQLILNVRGKGYRFG